MEQLNLGCLYPYVKKMQRQDPCFCVRIRDRVWNISKTLNESQINLLYTIFQNNKLCGELCPQNEYVRQCSDSGYYFLTLQDKPIQMDVLVVNDIIDLSYVKDNGLILKINGRLDRNGKQYGSIFNIDAILK